MKNETPLLSAIILVIVGFLLFFVGLFALLSGRHPNVTFAPMYDAMWRGGAFTWKPSFNAAKILCFSWALRAEVMRRAPVHTHVQYFPDPASVAPVTAMRGVMSAL